MRFRILLSLVPVTALVLGTISCQAGPFEPGVYRADGFDIVAAVTPYRIPQGGSAELTAVLHNTRDSTVVFESSCPSMKVAHARSGTVVHMDGPRYACTLIPWRFEVAPRDSLLLLRRRFIARVGGKSVDVGSYIARLSFPGLPALEARFEVSNARNRR